MLMKANYHTHCLFCDGKESPESMAHAAFEAGFRILGFSSHAPLDFETSWTMKEDDLPAYLGRIASLRDEFSGRMEVLSGLEIDWIPGIGKKSFENLDFSIGAVHFVKPQGLENDELFTVDGSQESFDRLVENAYGGDAYTLVEDYFTSLKALIDSGGFDILAHFDLPRKNNPGQSRFDTGLSRYRDAAMMAVDALEKSNLIVEVSTGGMAKGRTNSPYPELWILKELQHRRIPVCLNSDAHEAKHLALFRDRALQTIEEAGYNNLEIITLKGRQKVPLS